MKLDKEKRKAIVEMERPTDVKQLATFLRIITYVAKFIPNVKVSVGSSKDSLGAVLLQDNLPIAYAAKALNPTQ